MYCSDPFKYVGLLFCFFFYSLIKLTILSNAVPWKFLYSMEGEG